MIIDKLFSQIKYVANIALATYSTIYMQPKKKIPIFPVTLS